MQGQTARKCHFARLNFKVVCQGIQCHACQGVISACASVRAVHMVPCEGRLIQLWMYYRNGNPDDNHYAHPLDFIPVVDLNLKKVRLLSISA